MLGPVGTHLVNLLRIFLVLVFDRVPETCTLAALGEYLHMRFKLKGEVLPAPGSAELEAVYLFPGENASTSAAAASNDARTCAGSCFTYPTTYAL